MTKRVSVLRKRHITSSRPKLFPFVIHSYLSTGALGKTAANVNVRVASVYGGNCDFYALQGRKRHANCLKFRIRSGVGIMDRIGVHHWKIKSDLVALAADKISKSSP